MDADGALNASIRLSIICAVSYFNHDL